jgi:hypothetical protein
MITKDKVSVIILENYNNRHFVVYGLNQYNLRSKRHSYKTYNLALKYSQQLSDYYQCEVKELRP